MSLIEIQKRLPSINVYKYHPTWDHQDPQLGSPNFNRQRLLKKYANLNDTGFV